MDHRTPVAGLLARARRTPTRAFGRALATALLFAVLSPLPATAQRLGLIEPELAERVEIRRTEYGVPHILAQDLRAGGFGLAYVQLEDYGFRVVRGLVAARGELGRYLGHDSIEGDFRARLTHARAVETYHLLDVDTRDVLEGFAAGVNHYIMLHPEEFPEWVQPIFTGHDVHARDIGTANVFRARRMVERMLRKQAGETVASEDDERVLALAAIRPEAGPDATYPWHPDEGSNAWAFAPSRTKSGNAILVRNPHLSWSAGYYEAHLTVPGVLNFYGDFRIGGPFTVIGGFNERLGFSTTNNYPDTDEVYALDADPERPDHYLFDGASLPLRREVVTVEFRNGDALGTETRELWSTALGPVVAREGGKVYVLRAPDEGEWRSGMQFLRMMRAQSLEEWKDAMRMHARATSNFTYADADGNIFYVWNTKIPVLPHAPGGDTTAIPAAGSDDIWTHYVPWDSLPQLANPEGGYVRNENDPFHLTNLNEPFDAARYPANFPPPRLRLRSQLSLELIHNDEKFSLEDVVRLKHDYRMLLADRVKDDLVRAVRATQPSGEIARAIDFIAAWDNTTAPESRGGVLFETWWWRYLETGEKAEATPESAGFEATPESLFREPWSIEKPTTTPYGLADLERAAEAFAWAVEKTRERYGAWDVAWGEVHRARYGNVDVPVGGCDGILGCFRVMWFNDAEDGKRVVRGGDGWTFAVEFGKTPRAYTILAYGQTNDPESPHFDDQVEMFARGEMKTIAFTERDIRRKLIRSYKPGEEVEKR